MRSSPPAAPAPPPERRDYSGADALTEQARWIIEAHNKRADGIQQRAMGFLGVIGVMLGLVLTALTIGTAPQHVLVGVLTGLTVAALLAASIEFVRCLWLAEVSLPSVTDLRSRWSEYASRRIEDERVCILITNDFLGSAPSGRDPLTTASADADNRAGLLKSGLRCLVASFVLLAILIISILTS